MAELRLAAYERSGALCECWRARLGGVPCGRKVTWHNGHLHHVIARGVGGSDELGNVAYIAPKCHREIHGQPQWTPKRAEREAKA